MLRMFGKNKSEIKKVRVTNKTELKAAMNRKEQCIEVTGELANKLKWMGKLPPSKVMATVAVLATIGATVPLTGGATTLAVAPALTAVTGTELAKVILACSVSAGIIIALMKDYNVEVERNGTIVRFTRK